MIKKRFKLLLTAAMFALLMVFMVKTNVVKAQSPTGHIIQSIPMIRDINERKFDTSSLSFKVSVIYFFSVYSDSTNELINYFSDLYEKNSKRSDFQNVAINIDPPNKKVNDFLYRKKWNIRLISDKQLELSQRFEVNKTPIVYIVDRDRKIRFVMTDFSSDYKSILESKLSDIFSESSKEKRTQKKDDAQNAVFDKKLIGSNVRFYRFCDVNSDKLLYISGESILWTYNLNKAVRNEVATDISFADWSDDCESIVFSGKEKQGIWIKSDEGYADRISNFGKNPIWSSRGDLIAFINRNEIWVYQRSTQKKWQISATGKNIDWSNDGKILIVTDVKDRVWMVSPFNKANIIERIFN